MVESTFLDRITQFLAAAPGLTPAPALIGIAEPAINTEIPAVVLSLEGVSRPGNGLGERSSLITDGVLVVNTSIDLANPVLPEEPTFSLLSANRLELFMYHGGLVKADGTTGPLTAADISVTVAGAPRPVVAGPPTGMQVQVDPLVGKLTFATPLPLTGIVALQYRVGQWERRIARMNGVLRLVTYAASAADARTLSDGIIAALETAPAAVSGLYSRGILELSSIGRPDPDVLGSRSRSIRLGFEFELVIDKPDSSGGIINRVPVTAIVES